MTHVKNRGLIPAAHFPLTPGALSFGADELGRVGGRLDVVNANHSCAALHGPNGAGQRGFEAVRGGGGGGVVATGDGTREPLAGQADGDGPPRGDKLVEVGQDRQVLNGGFGKTDAGIHPDLGHPRLRGALGPVDQEGFDFGDDVPVTRKGHHVRRPAPPVHGHPAGPRFCRRRPQ